MPRKGSGPTFTSTVFGKKKKKIRPKLFKPEVYNIEQILFSYDKSMLINMQYVITVRHVWLKLWNVGVWNMLLLVISICCTFQQRNINLVIHCWVHIIYIVIAYFPFPISDYNFRKDEIFKRMKVPTFVQLVSICCKIDTRYALFFSCSNYQLLLISKLNHLVTYWPVLGRMDVLYFMLMILCWWSSAA